MGVTVATDRVACNTSTGDQAITVSADGLTPKAALFILVAATVDGTPGSDSIISYGAATGTSNRWAAAGYSEDGVTTSNTWGSYTHIECIQVNDGDGGLLCEADLVSFGTNTVTINWSTAPTSAWLLTVITFSGSDVSAHANSKDVGNIVDLEIDVTDPGFEPDIVFVSHALLFNPGGSAGLACGFGIVHNDGASTITQRALYTYEQDTRTTMRVGTRNDTRGGLVDGITTLDNYIEFSNFDSSGFSMTSRLNPGNNREHMYLALSFGGAVESWVGNYWTPTSIGSDSDTGPGFKPQFLFTMNSFLESIDSVGDYTSGLGGQRGMSAITDSNQFSTSFNSDSNVTTTDAESLSDNVAIELPDEDGSTGLTASFTSFDTNGWTFNYSAVETNAKLFFVLAIEEEGGTNVSDSQPAYIAGSASADDSQAAYIQAGTIVSDSRHAYISTLAPNKDFWYFPDESSVPSKFTSLTGGNGAISVTSVGGVNHLRVDNGGTASGDYACAVHETPLDMSKLTIISGEVKFGSGVVGAWVPNIIGVIDSSGTPVAMSTAARDAALRIWQEHQLSSGGDNLDRIQLKIKDSGGTQYMYVAGTDTWTSTFTHTRDFFDDGSYYRFVIIIDGTTSPKRARSIVYGYTEDVGGTYGLNYDSSWRDFDTGTGDIDPFDNDAYVIFGDPINSATRTAQIVFDFRSIMVAEIDTSNTKEFAFSNRANTTSGTFPFPYDIVARVNPMPEDSALWIPREQLWYDPATHPATAAISRGSDHWVKDAFVFYDGTTYWMFHQIRSSADSESDIYVSSTADILNGTWGSQTLISSPDTGESKHEFPWVTKYNGTWYMFYDVEFTSGPTWEIQYKTTTAANPTSGWSVATTILEPEVSGWESDGVNQPFLVWYSGGFTDGVWYMIHAGVYNNGGSWEWQGGLAKSTTGILGTYTKDAGNPIIVPETSFDTTLNGAHTDQAQLTVVSTSGLNAGSMIIVNDNPIRPLEVLSVDSGTTLTVSLEMTLSDADVLASYYDNWVAPRSAHYINGRWVIYVTPFKYSSGYEAVGIYVATASEIDLAECTFRELRVGDAPIHMATPVWNLDEVIADENFGAVWEAMTAPLLGEIDTSDSQDAYLAGLTYFPFTEYFTGQADEAAWLKSKWVNEEG